MDQAQIAELDRRLGIPGVAHVVAGQGGMAKVVVAAASASGELYLHGGHVTAWRPPQAEEVLFVSGASHWEASRAIRGGVPICFPWFGPKSDDPRRRSTGSSAPRRGNWNRSRSKTTR